MTWPIGAFSDSVVVEIAPKLASAMPTLPKDARVVQVTAFLRSTHAPVTELGGVIDVRFANATQGAHPLNSADGNSWRDIPQLQTLNLPDGQQDGWFRDSDGTIHVLARHLSYYALVGQEVSTKLAMRIITVRRLWLKGRSFVAVRMTLTAPARVTGTFVAPDGSTVTGQSIKTPTRHAGATILRVPLRITQPGSTSCRCTPRARARRSTGRRRSTSWRERPRRRSGRTAHRGSRSCAAQRASSLDRLLGKRFVVRRISRRRALRRARYELPHSCGCCCRRSRHGADVHARRAPRAAAGSEDRRADQRRRRRPRTTAASA